MEKSTRLFGVIVIIGLLAFGGSFLSATIPAGAVTTTVSASVEAPQLAMRVDNQPSDPVCYNDPATGQEICYP